MSDRRDGLLDELARVRESIVAHQQKVVVVDEAQWLAHLDRLKRSERVLLAALEREEAA